MIRPNKVILYRIKDLSDNHAVSILTTKGHLVNPETGAFIDCTNDYGGGLSAYIGGLVRDGYLLQLDEFHVALTDKGIHPYHQSWEDIKHFLFTSVLVPIAVSVVTTWITLYITS